MTAQENQENPKQEKREMAQNVSIRDGHDSSIEQGARSTSSIHCNNQQQAQEDNLASGTTTCKKKQEKPEASTITLGTLATTNTMVDLEVASSASSSTWGDASSLMPNNNNRDNNTTNSSNTKRSTSNLIGVLMCLFMAVTVVLGIGAGAAGWFDSDDSNTMQIVEADVDVQQHEEQPVQEQEQPFVPEDEEEEDVASTTTASTDSPTYAPTSVPTQAPTLQDSTSTDRAPTSSDEPISTKTESPTSRPSMPHRIVGGREIFDPEQYNFFGDWWWGCGTSLVAKDMVLTAAHCHDEALRDPISFNSTVVESTQDTVQVMQPIEYAVHPQYQTGVSGEFYDFLLMKLDGPVEGIQPVRLNDDSNIPTQNQLLDILGFGWLGEFAGPSETLRHASVKYIGEACSQSPYVYASYDYLRPGPTQEHLCAGSIAGGIDSCFGDSGGPLFFFDSDTFEYVQVGVVSWGDGCARAYAPGVYARVSTAYDWLKETICDMSDHPPAMCSPGNSGNTPAGDGGAGNAGSSGIPPPYGGGNPGDRPANGGNSGGNTPPSNPANTGSGSISISLPPPNLRPESGAPTFQPTSEPTTEPTVEPTPSPTQDTGSSSSVSLFVDIPSFFQTDEPTHAPTKEPTQAPVVSTTPEPTQAPVETTPEPTDAATDAPTTEPSQAPSQVPSSKPSLGLTDLSSGTTTTNVESDTDTINVERDADAATDAPTSAPVGDIPIAAVSIALPASYLSQPTGTDNP